MVDCLRLCRIEKERTFAETLSKPCLRQWEKMCGIDEYIVWNAENSRIYSYTKQTSPK